MNHLLTLVLCALAVSACERDKSQLLEFFRNAITDAARPKLELIGDYRFILEYAAPGEGTGVIEKLDSPH